jgi:cellulose synthase/poly-beta-1,6-N-acetylglucosamine synthase-like glycosyltransferase
VELARALGVSVAVLDMSVPFTAARARNEGFRQLRELAPGLSYVQFVDGDCEVVVGWLDKAGRFLDDNPDIAAVCGRRRERYPEDSVYNMLCDIEWDTPVGQAKACGGDAMMRISAFESVGGFCADLIAGEEPEICMRLRAAGWKIWRLEEEMTLHDAAMKKFGQWWQRSLRGGYGFAQSMDFAGSSERLWRREARSAWLWGVGIPIATVIAVSTTGPGGLGLLAIYPLQIARLAWRERRSVRENWWRAWFMVLGKFPEALGQAKYFAHRFLGEHSQIIEYK